MPLLDANGGTIPTDRCACNRHKRVAKSYCCDWCASNPQHAKPVGHSNGCNMVQENFRDTHRGVVLVRAPLDASYLPRM
jgi:hypothetical protein